MIAGRWWRVIYSVQSADSKHLRFGKLAVLINGIVAIVVSVVQVINGC